MTPLYFGKEKGEKRKTKRKSSPKPNNCSAMYTRNTNGKTMTRCFQRHP